MPTSNLLAQQTSESSCKQALLDARKRLERNKGVQVVKAETGKHGYPDSPSGRLQEYSIVLANNQAGTNVMNSPVLVTSIASAITSTCNTIGLVKFDLYQTDWVRSYGLVGSRVKQFKCLDIDVHNIRNGKETYIDDQGNRYQDVAWGYERCL
jgi:hypothetical protein